MKCTQRDKHFDVTARRCEEGSDQAPRWRSRALEGGPLPGPHTSEHPALLWPPPVTLHSGGGEPAGCPRGTPASPSRPWSGKQDPRSPCHWP